MAEYRGINGVARKVNKEYRGVNGVARKVIKAYRGVNGVARQYFSANMARIFQIAESTDTSIDSSSYVTGGSGVLTVYLKAVNGASQESTTYNGVWYGIEIKDNSGSLGGKTVSFTISSVNYTKDFFHPNIGMYGGSSTIDEVFTTTGTKSYTIPAGTTILHLGIWARFSHSGTFKITDFKIDGQTIDLSV